MANYVLTTYVGTVTTVALAAAELETRLETVDVTKTVRAYGLIPMSNNRAQCWVLYDT